MTADRDTDRFHAPPQGHVDRRALVARHAVRLTAPDARSPLTVGNGELCFTVDVTGLQTFPDAYPVAARDGATPGSLLGTQAQWGWHSIPAPRAYAVAESVETYASPRGPVPYVDLHGELDAAPSDEPSDERARAEAWLRGNPHRLDLLRLGLVVPAGVGPGALADVDQRLDLAAGLVTSRFALAGRGYRVRTSVHPGRDVIAVHVVADDGGEVAVRLAFPYGSTAWGNAADWDRPDAHRTRVEPAGAGWLVRRTLDATEYVVRLTAPGASLAREDEHALVVRARGALSLTLGLRPGGGAVPPVGVAEVEAAAAAHWDGFWSRGAAVELAGSADPRALELERRVVLSQYLTAIQCGGSMPPAETGLTLSSWRGKVHLEMHWWHAAHFALWDRPELLERSLPWYESVLPLARETARAQGLAGARWPKQVGPDGAETPSPIGPFLVWQQPHLVHLAELAYRARPTAATLARWEHLVAQTADAMASLVVPGPHGFELGPPLVPAQESYADRRATSANPTFELAYWAWALSVACAWRRRAGRPVPERWAAVAAGMRPPAQRDGRYVALATPPYLVREDHPSMLAALGMVPPTALVDARVMGRTIDDVLADWDWDSAWGWDFPMVAMTATRLGQPGRAVDALLAARRKNRYLANGHNRQDASLPVYLPGNGGLLAAVALMAGGWDGSASSPGFGPGWTVAHDGLVRSPGTAPGAGAPGAG